jgi:two-component system cell cycle response regulator
MTELGRETLKARRTGEAFTLAFIDIDHLKATNDALGHGAGDRLIVRAVKAIQSVVREYDLVVRYGGDEFLCGTLGLPLADARGRFEQLNESMAAMGGGTASVGVAQLGRDENLAQLISRADAAMFDCKRHFA